MLDDATKKRINTLRQILVGKLPDPKAQVEQITNGLIYKFMNDMDEQSVSMGGKSTYFSGRFQKYSWKNLMNTKTSGVEKIKLYSDAIEQMYTNENLPELFREIFKNSFLPFKDPSTLNMFLKEINEFHYSNSEKLGDAFEYLLSFMGSQGDAGQFRTPRHIIDFIVGIVNPKKNETILDPACGTAGFLISSYKHILKQNTKKNLGDELTAADRKKIGENLNGYDISPDMVKMSLVNMYLHKFTNPKINEYDTLSSEERWNEYYDVILANPPFFSPKGGITPHNRFGVKSTKAEVLFVDYINEHLKPNGRAGIIVPEGIIFQSGKAYKQLKKKLIETSLIGVISLPAGVFQPYSGVKTSVLILDKKKNKKLDNIIFISVENDGYSLGAQRKEIEGGQLENISKNFLELLSKEKSNKNSKLVLKDKILKSNDFSFSISNYVENKSTNKVGLKSFKIKDIINVDWGNTNLTKSSYKNDGKYLAVSAAGIDGKIDKYEYEGNTIVVSAIGAKCGRVFFPSDKFTAIKNTIVLHNPIKNISEKFLFYTLNNNINFFQKRGGGQPFISKGDIEKTSIDLPDLETQNQTVEELDSYQKIIEGCKQVIENYKPSIDIDPNWEMVELGDLCNVIGGGTPSKGKSEYWTDGNIKWLSCKHLSDDGNVIGNELITEKGLKSSSSKLINSGSVILVNRVSLGKVVYTYDNYAINQDLTGINSLDTDKIDNYFIYLYLSKINQQFIIDGRGLGVKGITRDYIKKIQIPVPPIEIQKTIIGKVKKDLSLISENKLMISRTEERINNKLNQILNN